MGYSFWTRSGASSMPTRRRWSCWGWRTGQPISGVVCYPRAEGDFCFGEMARLRYVEEWGAEDLHHFPGTYVYAGFR